ncbi:type VI secretion system lipoprotein TssJ [Pseudomonas sp. MAHUQ-62]|uniref:type VI secretion system lipoprotein TssJ n=1 Tax=Pseudomonas sp. GCM10023245 TaxID=3252652 RepID=UPI003623C8DF
MLRIVSKSLLLAMLGVLQGGCGLYQGVTDASTSTARAIFYKQVRTLHLDFSGRAAMNTNGHDMNALSVPTLVRIYQLGDRMALEKATYESLLSHADTALASDLLDQRAVVVKPGEGAKLSVPMNEEAQVVAVVALFRQPDTVKNSWRLVLTRDDLNPDRPRVIELGDNSLLLRPLSRK